MYVHTKLANGCVVTEKTLRQHIVETKYGYIIRCSIHPDCFYISAVLNNPRSFHTVNTVMVPRSNYRALRAVMKAFVALAPMHERTMMYM